MKNILINSDNVKYDIFRNMIHTFNKFIQSNRDQIQCYVYDPYKKFFDMDCNMNNFIVCKSPKTTYGLRVATPEKACFYAEMLAERVRLEYYLRKEKKGVYCPLFIISADSSFLELTDSWKYNIFFISVFDLQDDLEHEKMTKYWSKENFNTFGRPEIINMFNDYVVVPNEGTLIVPQTQMRYQETSGTKNYLNHTVIENNYNLTIQDLIYAIENNLLNYLSPEVKRLVISENNEECLKILKTKQEIINFMKIS